VHLERKGLHDGLGIGESVKAGEAIGTATGSAPLNGASVGANVGDPPRSTGGLLGSVVVVGVGGGSGNGTVGAKDKGEAVVVANNGAVHTQKQQYSINGHGWACHRTDKEDGCVFTHKEKSMQQV
jgi:hypothetical protein